MSNLTLKLFPSQPLITGGLTKTSFSTTPTVVDESNAAEFFRFDHTTILFKDGHSKGEKFVQAEAIPLDIDNSHSEDPDDWIHPGDFANRLKELGINFVLTASRHHLLSKEKNGVVYAPRPKIHGFFPLSTPLDDSNEFVRHCEWCIRVLGSDVQVKSRAQKMCGYGDNPNAFVMFWTEGRCVDEVLTDDDLNPATVVVPVSTTDLYPQNGNNDFDRFVESGEWQNNLSDLEALGWGFFAKDDRVYFQTPDGDHSPGMQDGNINANGVAYFFSKAPPPFENNKGYTVCQLYAGALSGDIGKEGLRKFAERYLRDDVEQSYGKSENIGIDIPVSQDKPTTPDIVLHPKMPLMSADKFIETVYTFDDIPTLIYYADDFWQWDGNAYRKIEDRKVKKKLTHFLEWVGSFPVTPARLNAVVEMLKNRVFRSISDTIPCWIGGESCEMPSSVIEPSLLVFGKSKILNLADMERMDSLSHSPRWLNLAALDFDYDSKAVCPKWDAFLEDIFCDDKESKQTLMEWMGLCLTTITKFQKALFLVGPKRSGKGTIARILQKTVGFHNTVSPSTADFGERFGLQAFIGKTLAIISDARFTKHGSSRATERILNITGEDALTIDRKNREAVTLRLQTKLTFISNEVPNILDQSGALPSRFIFLRLPKSFYGMEDVELESKLSNELPGIFCLAIQHLKNLLERGCLIQPETGKKFAERMTALSSPISEFMQQLQPGMTKEEIWEAWVNYCTKEGLQWGRKDVLWNDLETAGYDCDFDKADILSKIKQHGGESTIQQLRNSTFRFRKSGGTERLKTKLAVMVDAGLLTVRDGEAGNGQIVQVYGIANVASDEPVAKATPDYRLLSCSRTTPCRFGFCG